jgi:hypothetical protein
MSDQELTDYFSGDDEVEITEELIALLVTENTWGEQDVSTLRSFKESGGRWNTKRKSVVFPAHFFTSDIRSADGML